MTESPSAFPRPPAHVPVHPVLWLIAGAMVAVELASAAGERYFAYNLRLILELYLAFFDFGVETVRVIDYARDRVIRVPIASDPLWSTLTHAFLHGGLFHVGLNVAVFLALGHTISQAIGIWRTLALFWVAAVAGAVLWGVIADTDAPLVGCSGAVFGFLGLVIAWRWRQFGQLGIPRGTLVRLLIGLAVVNVVVAFGFAGLGGQLAWEAHLGGFLAGWAMSLVWQPEMRLGDFR